MAEHGGSSPTIGITTSELALQAVFEYRATRFRRFPRTPPRVTVPDVREAFETLERLVFAAWVAQDVDALREGASLVDDPLTHHPRRDDFPGGPFIEWFHFGSPLEVLVSLPGAFAAGAGAVSALLVLAEKVFTFPVRVSAERARLEAEKARYSADVGQTEREALDALAAWVETKSGPERAAYVAAISSGRFVPRTATLQRLEDRPAANERSH